MTAPLRELESQLGELEADLDFVALAIRLRPRLGDAVRWEVGGETVELMRAFMNAKGTHAEGFYGSILVRVLGALERYVRHLIEHCIEALVASAELFEDLPAPLRSRNIKLTGKALAAIDEPRDHVVFDLQTLIDNLASCKQGTKPFRLNTQAFSAVITGASPANLDRAIELLDVAGWWDAVGRHGALAGVLGTRGARATADRAQERLRELWRWRNHLAHGGDEQPAISEIQCREAIAFLRAFALGLDTVVSNHITRAVGS